jgi:hypothetical protein
MQNVFGLHAPEPHDTALVSISQTTHRAGALVPTLRVLVQPVVIVRRAEVGDQDRGARGGIGLVVRVGVVETRSASL